jgi:hypothetical protein
MVKERHVLESEVDGEEERGEVRRGLVVKKKVRQRVRERAEERDNKLEGRDIGGGGAGLHGVQVNVPVMQDNEACPAADLIVWRVRDERVAVEGGVKGIGGDGGKLRDEGSVWWGSLFAFVFSGLGGGEHTKGVRRRRRLEEERGSSESGC